MKYEVFTEFDAFAASVPDIDSKMLLRNPRQRVWSNRSVQLAGINVQMSCVGSGNIAHGQVHPDSFILYLPLTPAVKYSANGNTLLPGSLAILEPGSEFCISTRDDHDWMAAFIPTRLLPQDHGLTTRGCRVTPRNFGKTNQFRSTLLNVLKAAARCDGFETTPAARAAATAIQELCLSIAGISPAASARTDGRPKISRDEIIQRCMAVIEQPACQSVTVSSLATAADVSERTLRNAFHEYFGVGPARYVRMCQLHELYRALRAADPRETTVAEVMAQQGQWAFGRVAIRYRNLFGELPSYTLRRNPGC